ncbi:hypothetical protein TB2_019424 [Malus domestica]
MVSISVHVAEVEAVVVEVVVVAAMVGRLTNGESGILNAHLDLWCNFCKSPGHHISASLHCPARPSAGYRAFPWCC